MNNKHKPDNQSTMSTFEDFFKIPTRVYRNVGRDPLDMRVKTLKEKVLSRIQCYIMFAYMFYMFVGLGYTAWKSFHIPESLTIALGALSCFIFGFSALMKEFVFMIQTKTMLSVTAELNTLFPKDFKLQTAYHVKEYHRKVNFLLTCLVTACLGFTMGWAIYPIIKLTVKMLIFGPPVEKEFAFFMDYPYDAFKSNFIYGVTFLGEIMAALMVGTLFLSVDMILSAIIYNCCMHLDHISRTIENYIPTGDSETDLAFLDPLIKLHIKILKWVTLVL